MHALNAQHHGTEGFQHFGVIGDVARAEDDAPGRIHLDVAGLSFADNAGNPTRVVLYQLDGGSVVTNLGTGGDGFLGNGVQQLLNWS